MLKKLNISLNIPPEFESQLGDLSKYMGYVEFEVTDYSDMNFGISKVGAIYEPMTHLSTIPTIPSYFHLIALKMLLAKCNIELYQKRTGLQDNNSPVYFLNKPETPMTVADPHLHPKIGKFELPCILCSGTFTMYTQDFLSKDEIIILMDLAHKLGLNRKKYIKLSNESYDYF